MNYPGLYHCNTCLKYYKSRSGFVGHVCKTNQNPQYPNLDNEYGTQLINHDKIWSNICFEMKGYGLSTSILNKIQLGLTSSNILKLEEVNTTKSIRRNNKYVMPTEIMLPNGNLAHYNSCSFLIEKYNFSVLDLYGDEFEINNPLGKSRGKQKVLAMYVRQDKSFSGKLKDMYPLAVIKSKDVNNINLRILLKDLIDNLNSGKLKIRFIMGDTLWTNQLCGFICSFGIDSIRPCRLCTSTVKDMRRAKFSNKSKRPIFLKDLIVDKAVGIKEISILAEIYPPINCNQILFDLMHCFYEGICKFHIKCFCKDKHNMIKMNVHIAELKGPSKPNIINNLNGKINLNESSSQMKCIVTSLPKFIMSNPEIDRTETILLMMLFKLSTYDTYEIPSYNLVSSFYKKYMKKMHNKYGLLIPKFHFFMHLIEQCNEYNIGLSLTSCIRFEGMHQIAKKNHFRNQKNITFSILERFNFWSFQ